jgi:hypothetical protein
MTGDSDRGPEPRLRGYLDELSEDPPAPSKTLVPAVVIAARWQYVVRPYLLYFGRLLGAIGASLRVRGRKGTTR